MHAGYDPSSAGERWNVNLPAVIGVVFVFLVGVVVWVIATSGGDDDGGVTGGIAPSTVAGTTDSTSPTTTPGAAAGTTTPAPMPSTTTQTSTPPPTSPSTAPPTTEPVETTTPTTAPGAAEGAVPGDLGVPGRPMQQPPCDGSYITVLASPIGAQANASSVAAVLDDYPGSNYLRTDQTCPSLTPDVDGEPIYVIFLGPFAFDSDACAARAEGPEGAYARRLSDELGPDHSVACA